MVAFSVLRDILIRQGKNVGPIVTLSYKNHALDEFLMDVMKTGSPDLSVPGSGKLIRLGKPEAEALLGHTERNSSLESAANKELVQRIGVMKDAKVLIQEILHSTSISGSLTKDLLMRALSTCVQHTALFPNSSELDKTPKVAFDALNSIICQECSINAKAFPLLVTESEHWALNVET